MVQPRQAAVLVCGLVTVLLTSLTAPLSHADPVYTRLIRMDWGWDMALAPDGSAVVTGWTTKGFEATPGAYDVTPNGESPDAFVAKVDATGQVMWATYLGGPVSDTGTAIAVGRDGSVFAAGDVASGNGRTPFPTTPGALSRDYPAPPGGDTVGYLTKFTPNGDLVWSTLLPGIRNVNDIEVDAGGRAHLTGDSYEDFPLTDDAFDTDRGAGAEYYLATVSADGGEYKHASYVGGSNDDLVNDIELTPDGRTYVGGTTSSDDLVTTEGAFDRDRTGAMDTFVMRISPGSDKVEWSTYLGGSAVSLEESLVGIAVDQDGSVVVTGIGDAADFPVTPDADYPAPLYSPGGWMARLAPDGADLSSATFLPYVPRDPQFDGQGDVHVAGMGPIADYPHPGDHFGAIRVEYRPDGHEARADGIVGQYIDDFAVDSAGSMYLLGYPDDRLNLTTPLVRRGATVGSVSRLADCTIRGTSGDDVLEGTPKPDVICAGRGDDVVRGAGSFDVIRLDRGNDIARAGGGVDVVLGGRGADRIFGGDRRDLLAGQSGADTVFGGAGNDTLRGGGGRDLLAGQSGRDELVGQAGDIAHQ